MDEVVTQDENKVNRYMTAACTADVLAHIDKGYQNSVWTFEFMERGLWHGQSGHQDMEGNFQWARQQQINWLKHYGYDDPDNYPQ